MRDEQRTGINEQCLSALEVNCYPSPGGGVVHCFVFIGKALGIKTRFDRSPDVVRLVLNLRLSLFYHSQGGIAI